MPEKKAMPHRSNNDEARVEEIERLYRRYAQGGLRRRKLRRMGEIAAWLLVFQPLLAAKRILDFMLSLAMILLLAPLLALGLALSGFRFSRTPRVGRWGILFDELSFDISHGWGGRLLERLRLRRLPVLLNILKGEMSFVGPRPAAPGELNPRQWTVRKRTHVRPGLISLWWIRRRANIDYGTELEADLEYVDRHGVKADLGITLRALPALLYGAGAATAPDRLTLLGIPITNVTMAEAVETILQRLDGAPPAQIAFVNADCANIAYRNAEYLKVLQEADYCFADGIGLKLAGKMLAREIKQNVNGTDLFPRLCEAMAPSGKGLYLLGARPGVAEAVADWVRNHYPGVKVCGFHHGYYQPEEEPAVLDAIRGSGADLLLVAFGAPRQDLWVRKHLLDTGVAVAMGVGGLFDFYSGRIARAPVWMREMGMEWVYRLIQEPGRLWKRYLVGNGLFLYRVLRERLLGPVKNRE